MINQYILELSTTNGKIFFALIFLIFTMFLI